MRPTQKERLRLFCRSHAWVLPVPLLSAALIFTALAVSRTASFTDALYYSLLPIAVFAVIMCRRFYMTRDYYEFILTKWDSIESYITSRPRSEEERNIQTALKRQRDLYSSLLIQRDEEQHLHRALIFRWIHQIKTPLSVIKLVTQKHGGDEDYMKIEAAAGDMQYDLEQLLSLYRLEDLKNDFRVERISLADAVRDSINQLKNSFIENDVSPKMDIPPELTVYTDMKWIKFILYQLTTNAIKYSPEGSTVSFAAAPVGNNVELSIIDAGCGIGPEDLPRVFDLFYTGSNGRKCGESSGMGLYMAKSAADFLGHSIRIESGLGAGTRVILELQATN